MAVRRELQARTLELHQSTEGLYWTGSGFHDHVHYACFLRAILVAHSSLGLPAAKCHGDKFAVAHEQQSIAALKHDLGIVDGSREAPDGRACDDDYAWGVRYALTGSHIGASVILKSGGVGDTWLQSYLRGAQVFAQTGGVRHFFETLDASTPDISRATLGARAVFECLRDGHAGASLDGTLPVMSTEDQ